MTVRRTLLLLALSAAAMPAIAGDPLPTVPAVVKSAHDQGIEYSSLLSQAWKGDEDAIGAMFTFENQGTFQGEAEKQHVKVLWSLLKHLGDGRYAEALEREDPDLAARIVQAIALQAGPELSKYPISAAYRNAER